MDYFVRIGVFGNVGRLGCRERILFAPGQRVVCRTIRGLEIGEVLALAEADTPTMGQMQADSFQTAPGGQVRNDDVVSVPDPLDVAQLIQERDGEVLRRVTAEDEMVRARLERYRAKALRACQRRLDEFPEPPVLLDAELLFDGSSLYFYFLGEVSEAVESLTDELARTYEAKARIGDFAKLLSKGCGPECGTAEGSGCSTGGCSGCATGGCQTKTS